MLLWPICLVSSKNPQQQLVRPVILSRIEIFRRKKKKPATEEEDVKKNFEQEEEEEEEVVKWNVAGRKFRFLKSQYITVTFFFVEKI